MGNQISPTYLKVYGFCVVTLLKVGDPIFDTLSVECIYIKGLTIYCHKLRRDFNTPKNGFCMQKLLRFKILLVDEKEIKKIKNKM